MEVRFDKSFLKSIKKINNQNLNRRILDFINDVEVASTIGEIPAIKKIVGSKNYYRKRLGDYRIGFELVEDSVILIIIAHRKDIYKIFP